MRYVGRAICVMWEGFFEVIREPYELSWKALSNVLEGLSDV